MQPGQIPHHLHAQHGSAKGSHSSQQIAQQNQKGEGSDTGIQKQEHILHHQPQRQHQVHQKGHV